MNKRVSNGSDIYIPDDPGVDGPVKLKSRDPDPVAMHYQESPFPSNINEIITWLGDDFYAMTAGKPVTVNGLKISCDLDPQKDPLDQLTIIIDNSHYASDTKVVIATPGCWILFQETKGYRVLSPEQMDEAWTY